MENQKVVTKSNGKIHLFKSVVTKMLSEANYGRLNVTDESGLTISYGQGNEIIADITIKCSSFYKDCVYYGDIGFGESFCQGAWDTTDLTNVVKWAIGNMEYLGMMSGSGFKRIGMNILGKFAKVDNFLNRNTMKGSKKNISFHYDLSNTFYETMLDSTMSYSCGVFNSQDDSLEQAQINKLQKICDSLDIKTGDHILEIGCGWGSFSLFAAKRYDCHITGITISNEQYKYLVSKVKELNLQDKITVKLMDYRELEGQFDKVVSVEMIEAVGHDYLPTYFENIDRLLSRDGVAVIQAITSPDSRYDEFRKGIDFIQKHIFPGSLLPSIGAMITAVNAKTSMHLYGLEDIGLNYAKTLRLWDEKVRENKSYITELGMDELFFRKWHYYLCYCESAFATRNISTVQLTLIKPNNTRYKMK